MNKPPVSLAQLRDAIDELSRDNAAASEALAKVLHCQDEHGRCLRVILKLVRHLHGRPVPPTSPKMGAAARTRR